MEIRGLGVINIQDLFGIAATRTSKRIELVAQLERWEPRRDCPPAREALRRVLTLAILVQLAGLDQLDESEIEEFPDPGEEP